jgi:hypothetical protein
MLAYAPDTPEKLPTQQTRARVVDSVEAFLSVLWRPNMNALGYKFSMTLYKNNILDMKIDKSL